MGLTNGEVTNAAELLETAKTTTDTYAASLPPDGDWSPMLYVLTEDKGLVLCGIDGRMLENKDQFFGEMLPNIARSVSKKTPKALLFLVSSWMVDITAVEDKNELEALMSGRMGASQHPDRIEVLVLMGIDREQEVSAMGRIIRSYGPPTLEWKAGVPGTWEGRVISALRRSVWN